MPATNPWGSVKLLNKKTLGSLLVQLFGFGVLALLCSRLPFDSCLAALQQAGPSVLLVFALSPVLIVANMLAMSVLLGHRVPKRHLARIELAADAVARVIPSGGLAGEPYRAARYASWLGLGPASRSALHYRLVHATAGLWFTALTTGLTILLIDLPREWTLGFALLCGACVVLGTGAVVLSLSTAPSRVAGWVLAKLRMGDAFDHGSLARDRFLSALACKMGMLLLQLVELWVIFTVLGVPAGVAHVVLVAAMLEASSVVLFFMPQGLGANEAGIAAAFVLLGLPPGPSLAFGLIRRARIVLWTLPGLGVTLVDYLRRAPRPEAELAA